MMVVVFAGPTISATDVRALLPAQVHAPVAQGDVYRAVCAGARMIGIIDGYFDRVPSVWHKEIVWALSRGVAVYGSSSMGALRAAELAEYGMVGVGAVFQAFSTGALEDDDEVAVAHGAADSGYRPLSEAMVNVRATLASALAARVISVHTNDALLSIAKAAYYVDRNYRLILRRGHEEGLDEVELSRLARWLKTGLINQKRDDALAMLERMRDSLSTNALPTAKAIRFERTDAWDVVVREWDRGLANDSSRGAPSPRSPEGTPQPDLQALLHEEIRLFTPYALIRALDKEEALRRCVAPSDAPRRALAWYFEQRLQSSVPEELDSFARELGLTDGATLQRAILREYLYATKLGLREQ